MQEGKVAGDRVWQRKSGGQFTLGKNFDGTGGFGPDIVTSDELPPGGSPLRIMTRVNGQVMQDSNTDDLIFDVPPVDEVWSPLLMVLPLQLMAYHTAVRAGRDVDQPRNLAKSVTVE